MEISTAKTKIMDLQGKHTIRSKICNYSSVNLQINCFENLGYNVTFENVRDIAEKNLNYNTEMGVIN
jgi:hypothetical protein